MGQLEKRCSFCPEQGWQEEANTSSGLEFATLSASSDPSKATAGSPHLTGHRQSVDRLKIFPIYPRGGTWAGPACAHVGRSCRDPRLPRGGLRRALGPGGQKARPWQALIVPGIPQITHSGCLSQSPACGDRRPTRGRQAPGPGRLPVLRQDEA